MIHKFMINSIQGIKIIQKVRTALVTYFTKTILIRWGEVLLRILIGWITLREHFQDCSCVQKTIRRGVGLRAGGGTALGFRALEPGEQGPAGGGCWAGTAAVGRRTHHASGRGHHKHTNLPRKDGGLCREGKGQLSRIHSRKILTSWRATGR